MPIDYSMTVMLFKLFCVVGFEIVMLAYLHWASKFYRDEDFPGVKSKRISEEDIGFGC
jgi:hypothetical protein